MYGKVAAIPAARPDRRARLRRWRLEPGRVGAPDGQFSLACTIVDFTEDGARIHVRESLHLPTNLRLIDERQRVVYTATLIWSGPPDYGVKFERKDPL